MTPARRAAASNTRILLAEPRTLNDPVGCRCSHLSSTWQPVAVDRAWLSSNGVTRTCGLDDPCSGPDGVCSGPDDPGAALIPTSASRMRWYSVATLVPPLVCLMGRF